MTAKSAPRCYLSAVLAVALPFGVSVALDRFAGAFVAALAVPDETPPADELLSIGLVSFTLADDPLSSVDPDEVFDAGRRGCSAAAKAVGLPDGWTLETAGNFNGLPRIVCRGPVERAEVVEADTSVVSTIVGESSPPKR